MMKIIFSNRAFAAILAETTERITTETGGVFLGVIRDGVWYIVETIDPGPNSILEVAYFEYDREYVKHLGNKIVKLYQTQMDLVGLWHRHPGSFDQFSSTDDGTNEKFAAMRPEGAVSGLVNIDPEFRLTMYHVSSPCKYQRIDYDVGDEFIPKDLFKYKTLEEFFDSKEKQSANLSSMGIDRTVNLVGLADFMESIIPHLTAQELSPSQVLGIDHTKIDNSVELLFDDLMFMSENAGLEARVSIENNYLVISQMEEKGCTKIYFGESPKSRQLIFSYNEKYYLYTSHLFEETTHKVKESAEDVNLENDDERRAHSKVNGRISVIQNLVHQFRRISVIQNLVHQFSGNGKKGQKDVN